MSAEFDDRSSIYRVLVASLAVASLGALARHVALGRPVQLSALLSVVLYSSLGAGVVAWLLAPHVADAPALLVVVSALAGVGAVSLVDVAAGLWAAGGFCVAWAARREG